MWLTTPRSWYARYRKPWATTRVLLTPLAWVWAWVTAQRFRRAQPVDVGVPVISVGNLTIGGSGKTPIVRALAALLQQMGHQPHVVMRGYGGRMRGPLRVDPIIHTAQDVGDEAVMTGNPAPIWVSRDRPAGALAAIQQGAGLIILDDGHQNPSLEKTLTLIVVDGDTRDGDWPFGDGSVFPSGPMREPFDAGLARADVVILLLPADLDAPDPDLVALFGTTPVFVSHLLPVAPPPPGRQLAFAGIGKPWKMERALVAAGCDLADFAAFPDHGRYSLQILNALAERAKALDASLLTTDKDWARLSPTWRLRVTPWSVRAEFDDQTAMRSLLRRLIGERPDATTQGDTARNPMP